MIVELAIASVWKAAVRITDPFGPTEADPEQVRDFACEATAADIVCNPSAPDIEIDSSSGSGTGLGAFANVIVLGLMAALALGLAFLIYQFVIGRQVTIDDEEIDALDIDESIDEAIDSRVVDHQSPPDKWRRRADEHRQRGDYRESVRCEYRALVGDLARAGHVDEIPGRTSGEERAQVRELAPRFAERGRDVATQFDIAADTFDSAWFDDEVVTRADDERFVAASRAVLDVLLSGSGRRAGARRS